MPVLSPDSILASGKVRHPARPSVRVSRRPHPAGPCLRAPPTRSNEAPRLRRTLPRGPPQSWARSDCRRPAVAPRQVCVQPGAALGPRTRCAGRQARPRSRDNNMAEPTPTRLPPADGAPACAPTDAAASTTASDLGPRCPQPLPRAPCGCCSPLPTRSQLNFEEKKHRRGLSTTWCSQTSGPS